MPEESPLPISSDQVMTVMMALMMAGVVKICSDLLSSYSLTVSLPLDLSRKALTECAYIEKCEIKQVC